MKTKFKPVTQRMVLECGGNGRSFFTPSARGNQWTNGGAGCAEWTGVRLSDVLKSAGVKSTAVFTGHYGSDQSLADASKDALSRGVPIKKAMDGNNLIVFAMNGQPLSNIHGGPVRLIIPGWPGSVSAKWFNRLWVRDKYHDGPGMGATSYRVAIRPMVPGGKPEENNFRDLESMPVRSIVTSPANGDKFPASTKEVKLRGAAWAGDLTVQPRRRLDRLRRHLDARQARQAEEQVRLAALVGERHPAVGRLLRDLDARHQLQGRDATAHRRRLESAGLRRQSDAPRRGAGRLMRTILMAAGFALAALLLGSGGAFVAGAAVRAARREPRGLSGRRRPRRHVLRLHGLPQLQARGAAGHDPPAMGGLAAMDDRPAWHVAAAGEGAEGRARLSRSDFSAARAGRPWWLSEPVFAALISAGVRRAWLRQ